MCNSLVTIYKKKNYKILDNGKEYIIWNSNCDFGTHHTHISNYNTCKYIIDLCVNSRVPDKHLSEYLLKSILRLSDDENYKRLIRLKIKGGTDNGKRKSFRSGSNGNGSSSKR